MADNGCKWEPPFPWRDYAKCSEPPLLNDPKGYCLLHSEDEDKDTQAFIKRVKEKIETENNTIDLRGCFFPIVFDSWPFKKSIFPEKPTLFNWATFAEGVILAATTFNGETHFSGAKFLKKATFRNAIFKGVTEFSDATFEKGADFINAKFLSSVEFSKTTFKGELTSFRGAAFEDVDFKTTQFLAKQVSFTDTIFYGSTNFDNSHFDNQVYFIRTTFYGTHEIVKYKLPFLEFPEPLEDKISYHHHTGLFIFKGVMSGQEKTQLLNLSEDKLYGKTIEKLSNKPPEKLRRFFWVEFPRTYKQAVFADTDLSKSSFLNSNIDKVDFRYCKFVENGGRLNVLKDERDADIEVQKDPKNKKVREKQYEPVRRLYLELKKNFEDKKDWNRAGDFHFGEMECGRKMYGWSIVEGVLFNLYFWASGYGERPLRALGVFLILVFLVFPLLYCLSGDGCFFQSMWNSLMVTSFGRVAKPEITSYLGPIIWLIEIIVCPTQFALFALALRRKVKR
ncbi:MAG: pentapeptide repeat-containing protein [Candidatus Brocadiales bacterium]|nr:pentapeptide repeat-containing protein [Candidatus Bathyanammoxibius amoris]